MIIRKGKTEQKARTQCAASRIRPESLTGLTHSCCRSGQQTALRLKAQYTKAKKKKKTNN